MLESILESEHGEEANINPNFVYLKGILEGINETNITSFESIDAMYLTHITLLEHKNESDMGVGYKLISDKVVDISRVLQELPFSISKYLGCVLIMSILIVKTEDWCNLDDVSNFNICNFILNSIVEYYNNRVSIETNNVDDDDLQLEEHFMSPSPIGSDEYRINENRKRTIELEIANLKKRRVLIKSKNKFNSEIVFIIDATIKNLESISSVIGNTLRMKLIAFFRDFEPEEGLSEGIFYKLYIFNAIICFYRCSGSFLSKALSFKLPRGRYLIENGIGIISNFILKDMKIKNKKKLCSEFSSSSIFFIIIDYISMTLWFKIYIMRISIIVGNAMQEIVENYYLENCQVDKEYHRLELLNKHSELLTGIISNFIESNYLSTETGDNYFLILYRDVENILIKTTFEAIYSTFEVPLPYRNHFMMHFHVTEISNNHVLDLLYYIGYLVRLTIQEAIIYTDIDLIVYVLRTYLNIIYSITRFGDSSRKRMFTFYLSEGINVNFNTEMDKIRIIIENFIGNKKVSIDSNKYKKSVFTFTKYCIYLAARIKNILSGNLIDPNICQVLDIYSSSKKLQVFYYQVASLIYTVNFIGIMLSSDSSKQGDKRNENNYTFIEKIIIEFFSHDELKKIINLNQMVYNSHLTECQLFDNNFVFEFKFIQKHLIKYISFKNDM
ncbi:hypothetical protein RS030_213329 [Cryptosporidium xiaoi]|uniref:Uncharacterized protein n=1 Tax=Cryptosporidium xiaoi TaxID=659607 RepID=A0AAV9XXD4_9CRYT